MMFSQTNNITCWSAITTRKRVIKYNEPISIGNDIIPKGISLMGKMCASSQPITYIGHFQLDTIQYVPFEERNSLNC